MEINCSFRTEGWRLLSLQWNSHQSKIWRWREKQCRGQGSGIPRLSSGNATYEPSEQPSTARLRWAPWKLSIRCEWNPLQRGKMQGTWWCHLREKTSTRNNSSKAKVNRPRQSQVIFSASIKGQSKCLASYLDRHLWEPTWKTSGNSKIYPKRRNQTTVRQQNNYRANDSYKDIST